MPRRALLVFIACCFLGLAYIFQQLNVAQWLGIDIAKNQYLTFSVNKLARMLVNDFSCLLIIHAVFQNPKFNRLAFWVFCLEVLVLLPLYLGLKLYLEGTTEISSPILSQIHRLIVNPMLMVVLMAAFYYQQKMASPRG